MADERERPAGSGDFHTVGDTVLLDKFDLADGERDVSVRILHVPDVLWTEPDVQWVRVIGVEMDGDAERGPMSLFVVHRRALVRDKANV
ncbi:hypothetical protein [Catenuloplanes indicus]|uniref:Uncharacterized protein n=1 Tax=Catenuloplanes indicus TaxID=137267 RepID=A0AAE4AXX2_9ACTN|nr:hypothetical protein [Catenuloplanes indicus]MDQ0367515.1 hypothetical protein [Catenuloplanes indicus]